MMLLDAPVQGVHWASKKLDPTGRGIGTGPLGITEALLTFGAGGIKSGGKGLLKHGDELLEQGAKVLRGPQLAYEAIPVSPNVFNTKPLTTTNPMGIEGLSNVYYAKTATKLTPKLRSAQSNLDAFIKNETITDFETKTINIKGKEETIKIFPGTKEELTEKVQAYIRLREAAGHKQPRSGWHRLYGTLIGDDGFSK